MTAQQSFKRILIGLGLCLVMMATLLNPAVVELYFVPDERITSKLVLWLVYSFEILLVLGGISLLVLALRGYYSERAFNGFQKLATVMGALAIGFVLAEGFVRIFVPFQRNQLLSHLTHDPDLGWKAKSSADFKFSTHETDYCFETNTLGFRGSLVPKYKDKPVFGMFGDSFTFGYEVDEGETFCSFLEGDFLKGKINVLNFGVTGYGPHQELALYKDMVKKVKMDTVILMMYAGNDFLEINPYQRSFFIYNRPSVVIFDGALYYKPHPYNTRDKIRAFCSKYFPEIQLFNHLKLNNQFAQQAPPENDEEFLEEILIDRENNNLDIMRMILYDFAATAYYNEQVLVVALIPSWNQIKDAKAQDFTISSRKDLVFLSDFLGSLGNDFGYHFHNLTHPFIIETQLGKKLYFEGNLHLRPEGHAVVAHSLSQYLRGLHYQEPEDQPEDINLDAFFGNAEPASDPGPFSLGQ